MFNLRAAFLIAFVMGMLAEYLLLLLAAERR